MQRKVIKKNIVSLVLFVYIYKDMKTFLFHIHPVISESIELKALVSNVKVFLRFKSISKAVVFQNLELSRRLSSTCPLALRPIVRLTKGR